MLTVNQNQLQPRKSHQNCGFQRLQNKLSMNWTSNCMVGPQKDIEPAGWRLGNGLVGGTNASEQLVPIF